MQYLLFSAPSSGLWIRPFVLLQFIINLWNYKSNRQLAGLLGPSQVLPTQDNTATKKNQNAYSRIRTHDPSFRVIEDSMCLDCAAIAVRQFFHSNRNIAHLITLDFFVSSYIFVQIPSRLQLITNFHVEICILFYSRVANDTPEV
jgi:hypothetical protein